MALDTCSLLPLIFLKQSKLLKITIKYYLNYITSDEMYNFKSNLLCK